MHGPTAWKDEDSFSWLLVSDQLLREVPRIVAPCLNPAKGASVHRSFNPPCLVSWRGWTFATDVVIGRVAIRHHNHLNVHGETIGLT